VLHLLEFEVSVVSSVRGAAAASVSFLARRRPLLLLLIGVIPQTEFAVLPANLALIAMPVDAQDVVRIGAKSSAVVVGVFVVVAVVVVVVVVVVAAAVAVVVAVVVVIGGGRGG